MDNITIIKELKKGVDKMNYLLNQVEEILSSIDDDNEILDIIQALEVLYIKIDVTRHCIQEIREGGATNSYGERVIHDNEKSLEIFENKIVKYS